VPQRERRHLLGPAVRVEEVGDDHDLASALLGHQQGPHRCREVAVPGQVLVWCTKQHSEQSFVRIEAAGEVPPPSTAVLIIVDEVLDYVGNGLDGANQPELSAQDMAFLRALRCTCESSQRRTRRSPAVLYTARLLDVRY
jgi:hypothetical protein